jgi:CBS domain-containing protein
MQRSLVTLSPDDTFFDAIRTFLRYRISGAPVIDTNGRLVGICSERDCLEVLANGEYWRDDPGALGTVGGMMRTTFETVPPHADIYALAQRFVAHNVRRLPVIENGELIGQLSRRDVLRAMETFGARRRTRRRYPDYRTPAADVGARRSL